jgi:hypothetical protein
MIMTTIVLVVGFSSVLISDNRDHRAFAMLGVVTLSIALLCDLFCLPALVAVFDRDRSEPVGVLPTSPPPPEAAPIRARSLVES